VKTQKPLKIQINTKLLLQYSIDNTILQVWRDFSQIAFEVWIKYGNHVFLMLNNNNKQNNK
jgi:hypothetical protein